MPAEHIGEVVHIDYDARSTGIDKLVEHVIDERASCKGYESLGTMIGEGLQASTEARCEYHGLHGECEEGVFAEGLLLWNGHIRHGGIRRECRGVGRRQGRIAR